MYDWQWGFCGYAIKNQTQYPVSQEKLKIGLKFNTLNAQRSFSKLRCVFYAYVLTNAPICAKIKIQSFCGCTIGANVDGIENKVIAKFIDDIFDVAIRPLVNQLVSMGIKGTPFEEKKYFGDVFWRGVTAGLKFDKVSFFGGQDSLLSSSNSLLEVTFSKSIMRGFASDIRKRSSYLW